MGKVIVISGADFSAVRVAKVNIEEDKVAINAVASPSGGGVVTGSGSYTEGTSVTLTATANEGYQFVKWSDGNTNATRTITVGSVSQTYTAEFKVHGTINVPLDSYTQELVGYVSKDQVAGEDVLVYTKDPETAMRTHVYDIPANAQVYIEYNTGGVYGFALATANGKVIANQVCDSGDGNTSHTFALQTNPTKLYVSASKITLIQYTIG